jgi:hypothetical protein
VRSAFHHHAEVQMKVKQLSALEPASPKAQAPPNAKNAAQV